MKIENYKIIDGGIWIPQEELIRLADEAFKEATEAFQKYQNKEGCEYSALSLKCEGCADTFMHLLEKFEDNETIQEI